jgi:hypothetical protein
MKGFLKRLKTDTPYRIKLFLGVALVFNFLYSALLFVVGKIYSSKWYFVTSLYYGLLCLARGFVFVKTSSKNSVETKIKSMRWCGYFLVFVNLVFSIMSFILIYENRLVKYHQIVVIALATYTFTSLTVAIVNTVKYLRNDDRSYFSAKMIGLIAAAVSIVTLTNTMLSTFGDENDLLRGIILPVLSGAVALFIIACAVFMICKANRDLRERKNGK